MEKQRAIVPEGREEVQDSGNLPSQHRETMQVELQPCDQSDSPALPAPNVLFAVPCASPPRPSPPPARQTEGERVAQTGDGDRENQGARADTAATDRVSERERDDSHGRTEAVREGERERERGREAFTEKEGASDPRTEVGSEGGRERESASVPGTAKKWRSICWECKRGQFKAKKHSMPRCRGPLGSLVGNVWALGHTGPDFCDDPRETSRLGSTV